MSLEYAPRGLVGMLTPQANTTVEPEFNLLWPPGVAMINARLMSDKDTISARLVDYFANYRAALRQFANAPVSVAAAACTGASYLAGREREADLVQDLTAQHGYPFITAALAVIDALAVLKAQRIGLVSPYPDDLNRASVAYWQSHGLDVMLSVGPVRP
jgi:maleate isomerase